MFWFSLIDIKLKKINAFTTKTKQFVLLQLGRRVKIVKPWWRNEGREEHLYKESAEKAQRDSKEQVKARNT